VDDFRDPLEDQDWEAGFEGDRRIVVSRLGPFRRVFARPKRYNPRFFHRIYDLVIEDWSIPLQPPQFGHLCRVDADLSLRFQPTLRYAREHLEHLDRLGEHVKASYLTLLQDAAEQELRSLESVEWLDRGQSALERRIENTVHELLALRDIQSRARCRIEIHFADPDSIDAPGSPSYSRHQGVILELLRRRREKAEHLAREQYDRELLEQELRLEHEQRLLSLRRRELELRSQKHEHDKEQLRADFVADEIRYSEQIESELRLREERIRHEARLRQMELEADLAEKDVRAEALNDVENHLRREIELLAMERQRLTLEQEIQDVKVARARGMVINAKRRFPLGEDEDGGRPREAD
jgi:hypothetical protein